MASLAEPKPHVRSESIPTAHPTMFLWDYAPVRGELSSLYEKAKTEQWNVSDLDWSREVDFENENQMLEIAVPIYGSPIWERLTHGERTKLRVAFHAWTLSNLLHGEQGALFAASQIVTAAPDIEAKLYASTQAMDEARHVEAFSRYL